MSWICEACYSKVEGKKVYTPGSFGMELALWVLFILPGIIYSIWRLAGRYSGCPVCGHDRLVPADTPRGRALLAGQEKAVS